MFLIGFFINKILVKRDNVVFSNNDTGFDIAAFFSDGMGLVTINFSSISLDDYYFDEDDSTKIVLLDLLLGVIDLNNIKHIEKIDEESMPIAWHPTRVWDLKKDEKLWNDKSNT